MPYLKQYLRKQHQIWLGLSLYYIVTIREIANITMYVTQHVGFNVSLLVMKITSGTQIDSQLISDQFDTKFNQV